jgi:hypothetical protein
LPKTPRARLVKLLDVEWARIIKNGKPCQMCGKSGIVLHAAHIFSRRSMSTRWDLDNGLCLCYYHHIRFSHNEPIKFYKFCEELLGKEKLEQLGVRNAQIKKWSIEEMECLLKLYQQH